MNYIYIRTYTKPIDEWRGKHLSIDEPVADNGLLLIYLMQNLQNDQCNVIQLEHKFI